METVCWAAEKIYGHGLAEWGMAYMGQGWQWWGKFAGTVRLSRQDRLFNKGLSDPPHGGTP